MWMLFAQLLVERVIFGGAHANSRITDTQIISEYFNGQRKLFIDRYRHRVILIIWCYRLVHIRDYQWKSYFSKKLNRLITLNWPTFRRKFNFPVMPELLRRRRNPSIRTVFHENIQFSILKKIVLVRARSQTFNWKSSTGICEIYFFHVFLHEIGFFDQFIDHRRGLKWNWTTKVFNIFRNTLSLCVLHLNLVRRFNWDLSKHSQ